MITKR